MYFHNLSFCNAFVVSGPGFACVFLARHPFYISFFLAYQFYIHSKIIWKLALDTGELTRVSVKSYLEVWTQQLTLSHTSYYEGSYCNNLN